MAMDITFIVNTQCSTRQHIDLTMNVAAANGTRSFPIRMDRSNWAVDVDDATNIACVLLRNWFKENTPPPAQVKTLLEAKVFKY